MDHDTKSSGQRSLDGIDDHACFGRPRANWQEVVRYFIHSVEADAAADGTEETAALLARLRSYDGVSEAVAKAPLAASTPVLPMHFRKGETSLKLFTAIATLGTPQDITLQELRIESFFPIDNDTAEVLWSWARTDRSVKQ